MKEHHGGMPTAIVRNEEGAGERDGITAGEANVLLADSFNLVNRCRPRPASDGFEDYDERKQQLPSSGPSHSGSLFLNPWRGIGD